MIVAAVSTNLSFTRGPLFKNKNPMAPQVLNAVNRLCFVVGFGSHFGEMSIRFAAAWDVLCETWTSRSKHIGNAQADDQAVVHAALRRQRHGFAPFPI